MIRILFTVLTLSLLLFASCIPGAEISGVDTTPDAGDTLDANPGNAEDEEADPPDVERDCIEGSDEELCEEAGYHCGTHEFGERCDVERTTIRCGDCSWPDQCTDTFKCACEPLTCDDLAADCGTHDNGCGSTVTCPSCDEDLTCTSRSQLANSGSEDPNPNFLCTDQCIPQDPEVVCADVECGSVDNGCGVIVDCRPASECSFEEDVGVWEFLSEENCCNGAYNSCTCVEEIRRNPICVQNECALQQETRTIRSGCSSCFPRFCGGGTCGLF